MNATSRLSIISMRSVSDHYSLKVSDDAERALESLLGCRRRVLDMDRRSYWLRRNYVARTLAKCGAQIDDCALGTGREMALFLMWPEKKFEEILGNPKRRKWLYVFDSWEPYWPYFMEGFRRWKGIRRVFFSSLQTWEHFKDIVDLPTHWLPTAANTTNLRFVDREKKNCVFNIGRKNSSLNRFFESFCSKYGLRYVSGNDGDEASFANRAEFEKVLSEARIVVVHPRNIDSPGVTGSVSTVTARYYEAFQSGAVVCGHYPRSGEIERLFANYPFVEYQYDLQFEKELLSEWDHLEKWKDVARHAREHHNWTTRLSVMKECIEEDMSGR